MQLPDLHVSCQCVINLRADTVLFLSVVVQTAVLMNTDANTTG